MTEDMRNKYENVFLSYYVKDATFMDNRRNYQKMVEALADVGIYLNIEEEKLFLSISQDYYLKSKNRNAGRRKKYAFKSKNEKFELYKYSDIIYMMQTKKDQEVADEIGMKIATFYRHKKILKESKYYSLLDLNRLRDKDYLENIEGNYAF